MHVRVYIKPTKYAGTNVIGGIDPKEFDPFHVCICVHICVVCACVDVHMVNTFKMHNICFLCFLVSQACLCLYMMYAIHRS